MARFAFNTRHPDIASVMRGLRNRHGSAQRHAEALTIPRLRQVLAPLGDKNADGTKQEQKRMKTIIASVVLSLISTYASADWQYTRWGMTVDEVVSASKGQAVPINESGKNSKEFLTLLVAPYTGSGQKLQSYFRFDPRSRKLIGVELVPSDYDKCVDIRRILRSTYGTPSNTNGTIIESQPVWTTTDWRDLRSGNVVSLYESFHMLSGKNIIRGCSTRYLPIEEDGLKGEL